MTRFASKPVSPASDRATDCDSPADASSERDEDGVVTTLSCAVGHLCDERACGVVINVYRNTKRVLDSRSNGNIDHALKIRGRAQHVTVFDQTGQTDAEVALGSTSLREFNKRGDDAFSR
jgi:hypothetical protein